MTTQTPKAPKVTAPPRRLRSVGDLIEAHEYMFNQQRDGHLDAKTADAMNTTLKGLSYLLAKLPMDVAKLWVTAQIKRLNLPSNLFPLPLDGETKAAIEQAEKAAVR
jgi:hypothetical protein